MIPVQFPPPQFRIRAEGDKRFVFDALRKTWLLLTPEEWVRQNFVALLIQTLRIPAPLIALEKRIVVNGLKTRFDILVYDNRHQPWMLVECKAPQVPLTEAVLQQALRYNLSVPVRYLVITNGEATVGWENEGAALRLLDALPVMA